MSIQQYITDYKAHIKKPVQQQIKDIAQAYCEFHNIEHSKIKRNTQSVPMRIKLLHRLLRDASVLYSCDAQAQALKLSEYLILRRINETH
jgi:hypothetical protein